MRGIGLESFSQPSVDLRLCFERKRLINDCLKIAREKYLASPALASRSRVFFFFAL